MKTLSVIVIFLVSFYYPKQIQGSSNSFKIESAVPCPNNKKLAATFLNMNSFNTNGKLCVNAEIELKETIKGPIPMEIILARCTEDLSQCTSYPKVSTANVCNDFNSTFYGKDLLERGPKLKCPVKAAKYVFNNIVIDFTNLSKSSLISGTYKTKFVAYQMRNGNRRQILCWTAIARVSTYNSRKN